MKKHKYPFATIALYGPNDKVTTKIVVGIFKNVRKIPFCGAGGGKGVFEDHEIHQQILVFLKEHKVRKVIGTSGNIGCPHEEILDFPQGRDCPFCPFWKGKQGSGIGRKNNS